MPMRNALETRICASTRVTPQIPVLNDEGVKAPRGDPWGAATGHTPITGWNLLSLGLPLSSSDVTATDRVRPVFAEIENHGRPPKALTEPIQSPPVGMAAGLAQVSDAAH